MKLTSVKTQLIVAGVGLALIAADVIAAVLRLRRGSPAEKTAAEGIARHAKLYEGLYEGLCQILDREEVTDRDTLKEWCERTARLPDEADYRAAFAGLFEGAVDLPEEAYREKLRLLLKLIAQAGIVRGEMGPVTYDASLRKAYVYLGAGAPVEGETYNAVKPCWTAKDEIVEQGVIMKGGAQHESA